MQQVCAIQKPRNYQDDLQMSLRFKHTHNSAQWLHKHEEHVSILLSLESEGKKSSPRRTLMRQQHDIEPATT